MAVTDAWGGLPAGSRAFYTPETGGLATVPIEIPCPGPHYFWTLSWDFLAGAGPCGAGDADAWSMGIDPGPLDIFHSPGCQNCGGSDAIWHWAIVVDFTGSPDCDSGTRVQRDLTVGSHDFVFRGNETGDFTLPDPEVAAVAAIAVSNDPMFDPSTVLAP